MLRGMGRNRSRKFKGIVLYQQEDSCYSWRLVFLVSVPVGIVGTIWAYVMLREIATIRGHQKIDWAGNITFAAGATILLIGITYGIEPYGSAPTGWGNPLVIGALITGVILLSAFLWIELHVQRSEERRVGKECRSRWVWCDRKNK